MRKQKGFTLVELVVVVMILGILAAVAAPKLLGTSGAATDNGLKQTLAVVRDAIERFAAQNGGTLPSGANEAAFKEDLSTFLRGGFPVCPVGKKDATVRIVTTDPGAGGLLGEPDASSTGSWAYCSATGQFICNSDAATSDGSGSYDSL